VTAARALPRIWFWRPKPRPPRWWWKLAATVLWGLLAAISFAVGAHLYAAGLALWCASDWHMLVRWPDDALHPPYSATNAALDVGGFAFVLTSIVT
jgi:hypothetical protein